MRKLSFVLVLMLAGAVTVVGQNDPWWRPLSPFGQSLGVTYGTVAPSLATTGMNPAPGELWVDADGASDGGAALFVFNASAAAWQSPGMQIGASIIFEGAVANAFEVTLTVTEPTLDEIIGIPSAGEAGSSFVLSLLDVTANDVGDANAIWFGGTAATSIIFEGATGAADAFELMISIFDPAADRTVYVGDAGEAAGSFILTTLDAGDVQDALGIWGNATGGLVFEGATADAFEFVIDTEDPTVGVQVQMFPDRMIADTFIILTTHDGEMTASQFFLPSGGGLPADAAAAEDALAADFQVTCYRAYLPQPMTVTNTVLYEFQVAVAGADDFLGFAIYDDDDAGVQLAEGATVYAADGAPLVINHADVTLYPGFYRFCACQNDVSAQDWLGFAQTATVTAVYNQAVSEIRYGIATNACAGNADMPATTGALATTAEPMFVAHLQSN